MTENTSKLKKKIIRNLWAEYYEELIKVKKAISNSLYDIAINPINKAKIILRELEISNAEKVKPRIHELTILELMLYSYLKNKTSKQLEDKKDDLIYEQSRSILAANEAIKRNDAETALRFLKIAKIYAERISEL